MIIFSLITILPCLSLAIILLALTFGIHQPRSCKIQLNILRIHPTAKVCVNHECKTVTEFIMHDQDKFIMMALIYSLRCEIEIFVVNEQTTLTEVAKDTGELIHQAGTKPRKRYWHIRKVPRCLYHHR